MSYYLSNLVHSTYFKAVSTISAPYLTQLAWVYFKYYYGGTAVSDLSDWYVTNTQFNNRQWRNIWHYPEDWCLQCNRVAIIGQGSYDNCIICDAVDLQNV